MNEEFIINAYALSNDNLLKTEELFVTHRRNWVARFAGHFRSLCAQIRKSQDEAALPAISHLGYTMLYTNFIDRHYVADIFVYGEDSYLDNDQRSVGSYDLTFLFGYFNELWEKLLANRKRYVGEVSSQDVTSFMFHVLADFYSYLTSIARFAIAECVDGKPYADIVKNDEFEIHVGDYMANSEPVFTENMTKNANKMAAWFSKKHDYEYVFEDCSFLDFSQKDFSNTILRYVQFRKTILNDASLQDCSLIGANFRHAQLENCRLSKSVIHEADFSFANMRNSNLSRVRGKVGIPNKNEWQHVGYLPVSFRNADLTGADFTYANLTGADFTDANLTDTVFTSAILDNAIFSDGDMPLSEDQKSKIKISGKE